MRTLRITLIFAVLALGSALIVTALYSALNPPSIINEGLPNNDPIPKLIPIACGLLVAPLTLRANRWIERRMSK